MSDTSNKTTSKDVDLYIAALTEPAKTTLSKLREMIRKLAPDAEECLSYGMPAFRQDGPLVGYAAAKAHCGLYPMNGALVAEMKEDLKDYKTSPGAIQFPLDKPIPATLLKKIVTKRLKDNKQHAAEKLKKRK